MSAPYKAESTQLLVGVESTQGTGVSPSRHFGLIESETELPDPSIDWQEQRVIGGTREMVGKTRGPVTYDGGSIPIVIVDGAPLAYVFGDDSVAVDTAIDGTAKTGTDTHTIRPIEGDLPPTQTIEAAYLARGTGSAFVRTFTGGVPTGAELSVSDDSKLTCTLDYTALDVSTGTTVTTPPSLPSVGPWKFDDVSSDLTFFGVAFARLSDFTLGVDPGVSTDRYINSSNDGGPDEHTTGNIGYTLDVDLTVDDASLYNELINPTSGGFTATIDFTRSNGDTLRITCEGCNFEESAHPIPEEGKIEVTTTLIPEKVTIEVEDSTSAGASYV